MPGSSCPGRVPIGRPSRAVKPIVLSILFPETSAHMEAPLPRWATRTRPWQFGSDFWKPVGNVFVRKAVEAITTHALAMEVLGNGEAVGNIRMPPVKSCVEACDLRQFRDAVRG